MTAEIRILFVRNLVSGISEEGGGRDGNENKVKSSVLKFCCNKCEQWLNNLWVYITGIPAKMGPIVLWKFYVCIFFFSLLQGLVCTVTPPDFQAVIGFVQRHQQVCEVRNKAQISTLKASPTKQDRGSAEGCSCLQLPFGTTLPHQPCH